MKHLLGAWPELKPRIRDYFIMLFLDYDGTLTPLVDHPQGARLGDTQKKILEGLSQTPDLKVIIMSGRMLSELKQFVNIPGLIYVGNHGMELEGPSLQHIHPGARDARKKIEIIFQKLRDGFKNFPGIFVENKIFTLAVHYRELGEEKIEPAKKIFLQIIEPEVRSSQLVLAEGKKVWEIRPAIQWNKGTALLWLFGQVLAHFSTKVLPIYIGDDQTDEDAFRGIRDKGLAVKIIENDDEFTEALYFLNSTAEVYQFLQWVQAVKTGAQR